MTRPPLLTFAEAETVGAQLHDHWTKMAGKAPMGREDFGWADLVQRTMRLASNAVAARAIAMPVLPGSDEAAQALLAEAKAARTLGDAYERLGHELQNAALQTPTPPSEQE